MFDDDFTGIDDFEPCQSSGPVCPDKRERRVALPCPASVEFVSAPSHCVYATPKTGPPA